MLFSESTMLFSNPISNVKRYPSLYILTPLTITIATSERTSYCGFNPHYPDDYKCWIFSNICCPFIFLFLEGGVNIWSNLLPISLGIEWYEFLKYLKCETSFCLWLVHNFPQSMSCLLTVNCFLISLHFYSLFSSRTLDKQAEEYVPASPCWIGWIILSQPLDRCTKTKRRMTLAANLAPVFFFSHLVNFLCLFYRS